MVAHRILASWLEAAISREATILMDGSILGLTSAGSAHGRLLNRVIGVGSVMERFGFALVRSSCNFPWQSSQLMPKEALALRGSLVVL